MRIRRTSVLVCLGWAWIGVAGAQCKVASAGSCIVELHGEGAPRASASCADEAWKGHLNFELPDRFADANGDGWHEAVFELDVDPGRGCSCAVFRITYEGEPAGQTVNIGDSPTNDGYGGDEWSTRFDAELVIGNRSLAAYGSEQDNAPAQTQIFGLQEIPIADQVLELQICDQSIHYAIDPDAGDKALRGFFNTYRSRDLIAIRPGPAEPDSPAIAPDSRIYAAFNRVIHRRSGRPTQNRFGVGVRRVAISVTP